MKVLLEKSIPESPFADAGGFSIFIHSYQFINLIHKT